MTEQAPEYPTGETSPVAVANRLLEWAQADPAGRAQTALDQVNKLDLGEELTPEAVAVGSVAETLAMWADGAKFLAEHPQ